MAGTVERLSRNKCHGGFQDVYRHRSIVLGCDMRFAVFLPSGAATQSTELPVVYFLSGLTCTEQNVITKAGAQAHCEAHQVILVCPDTSPRGKDVPDDPADDLGQGAGFYVNASEAPWSQHYRMFDYVTQELPDLVRAQFGGSQRVGICGHSMGGHGALIAALRCPERYRSVSAFSPIASPSECPWGQKALTAYLGEDRTAWEDYDSSRLLTREAAGALRLSGEILIDVGNDDPFLTTQLKPELLVQAAASASVDLRLRRQPGYDHSYYFVATFMADHIRHHAAAHRT
jgi:S-formylglutathione hydrolase